MPNLNYGVPRDVPNVSPRCPQMSQDDLDAKILALIKKDNKISTEKLGMTLGVSYKTIRRHIKVPQQRGRAADALAVVEHVVHQDHGPVKGPDSAGP